ncbi:MAG: NAD-dependent epimerase/dehydratase family protein [Clostridia bacterium]
MPENDNEIPKMKVLVTGSTGHVGNATIRKLLQTGHYDVKVLIRETSKTKAIEGLNVEICYGDINDEKSVLKALENVDYCIHSASFVNTGSYDDFLMQKINILGTQTVVDACITQKIKRLVYVSSSHVLELAPSNKGRDVKTESDTFSLSLATDWYSRSKAIATNYVFSKARNKELDAVVVFPSAVIGPYDYKIGNSSKTIIEFMKGKIPARIKGSYNFVDSRDVAFGIVSALEKGKNGEGYLLSSETITVDEMFETLEKKTGIKAPKFTIPMGLAKFTAPISEFVSHVMNSKPLFTKTAVNALNTNAYFSHQKAHKELGFTPISVKQSLCDTVDFILEEEQCLSKEKSDNK